MMICYFLVASGCGLPNLETIQSSNTEEECPEPDACAVAEVISPPRHSHRASPHHCSGYVFDLLGVAFGCSARLLTRRLCRKQEVRSKEHSAGSRDSLFRAWSVLLLGFRGFSLDLVLHQAGQQQPSSVYEYRKLRIETVT